MVAHYRHNGFTDSTMDLLIIAIISGKCWSAHFFKGQLGSGSKSRDLFGDFGDYLLDLNLRSWSKYFENYLIKHNTRIHGDIAGAILGNQKWSYSWWFLCFSWRNCHMYNWSSLNMWGNSSWIRTKHTSNSIIVTKDCSIIIVVSILNVASPCLKSRIHYD